jgi:lipopolysaccharide transport system permease protein
MAMHEPAVRVYTPDSSLASPRTMMRDMFRDLIASRELAWRLTVRDITAGYRQAFLGMLWAVIMPLANAVIWIFLRGTGVVSMGETALPYWLYAFTGTMLWAIFIDAMNAPLQQTNSARAMLAKLDFPREALVISGIYQTLFHSAIRITLLIAALVLVGLNPGWNVLLFPVGILSLVLVGTAIGLLLTPVGVLYTDVARAITVLMQFMMFLSPVVFPMPKGGWVATLFQINPLTPLILTTRDWLTGYSPEYLVYFLAVNAAAIVLLLVVWVAYRLAMPILIERMSA